MNGQSVVPADVLEEIKGKDVEVKFDLGDGIVWTVNGADITGETLEDIDFAVTISTEEHPINTIPVEVINKVTGEKSHTEISLAHDGEFGFTAVLTLNLDAENAGLFANLYYYNVTKNALEFICADEIARDGSVDLTFTHASDYTIVIDEKAADDEEDEGPANPEGPGNEGGAVTPEEPEGPGNEGGAVTPEGPEGPGNEGGAVTPEEPEEPGNEGGSGAPGESQPPQTGDSSNIAIWFMYFIAGLGLVVFAQRKRVK